MRVISGPAGANPAELPIEQPVNSVPPGCVPVQVGAVVYQQCGTTWYQPQYVGSNVQYIVVNAPR